MSALTDWNIVKQAPPHDKSTWIEIIAHIRNNQTGEIRQYKDDAIWDEDNGCPHLFIWEEGNYSCDCNRKIFWGDSIGHEYEDEETPCGDGDFSINLENPKTGEIFYREYERA